ncbi:hypothetical protein [Flavobacterium ajazii]|uniref:hypothetical protein n=1 Tax=Flavobacterium ajazii TaxID=2692318 RepID=UPI0013CF83E5|nr:hypothetical protein [Flavobacterium ajazii]
MKKILFILMFGVTAGLSAQDSAKDDLALIQDIYGKSKKQVVTEYLKLSEPQATAFQEIYDAYETGRKELSQKKIQIIEDYAANYQSLTDEKAAELTEANLKNGQELDKLLTKTFSKAKKAIGGKNAAKFVQLEQYLQTTIRSEIQNSIPFIDELEKTKTTTAVLQKG